MVANSAIDVVGALAELELWRMEADHDQAGRGVLAMPLLTHREI